MTGSASARRLPNWITSFIQQTDNLESPEIFRKWAGIGVLSAALERRVWSFTKGSRLHPNLYVMLVAPPGVGKSAVISHGETMLRNIEELFIAPSSVTSASLIDTLAIAQRRIVKPVAGLVVNFNAVQVFSSELQNFMPSYEAAFMGVLTKLYDCELYEERRRTGKINHLRIDNTQLSIFAGTTPSYLNGFLPEGAWDQGFMARAIMIFSEEGNKTPLFGEDDREYQTQLYHDLVADLRVTMDYFGEMSWSDESKKVIMDWSDAGQEPVPQHGRLRYYNTRRLSHLVKLSMIACISRGDTQLRIIPEDFTTALDWLLEAEALIPDIFKSMVVTNESRIMQDAHYFLLTIHEKLHKPVPEHYLINFLKDRIPSQNMAKVIETMVRSRMLKQEYNTPTPCYTPIKISGS